MSFAHSPFSTPHLACKATPGLVPCLWAHIPPAFSSFMPYCLPHLHKRQRAGLERRDRERKEREHKQLQLPGVLWTISGMSHPKDLIFPPANRDPLSCPELGSPSGRGALDRVSAIRDWRGEMQWYHSRMGPLFQILN